ncbi:UDP-2,3-diacylglucosamine hydrolase [Sulfurimonas sp. SAG-AH-194-C20]|nr:metallophosphoesterase [Sulfurimonas sp. SAG-AH-194-C20]MDF1878906.1 UDP-2,3-diacylglucosamine hydrolase [Sulfurimonas sp. SAG-AH-194-C20]
MSHKIELQEGALLISDAHYSSSRTELLSLIKDIHSKKITTSQLILMGDVFDALFFEVPKTQENNKEMIKLLNEISESIELIYLEGNHDFNLKAVFKGAQIVPVQKQPLICTFKDKTVALAHGDFDIGVSYSIYTSFIRNTCILYVLNFINRLSNNFILNKLDNYLDKKDDCKEFVGFENYIKNRQLESFGSEYFIEGHYHQNKSFLFPKLNYINLAAFACNQRYFIVKLMKDNELVIDENRYVEI